MTPADPVWWLALAGVLLVGVALHELAHFAVAAVVADRARIDWRRWATVAVYPDPPGYRPALVAAAPLVSGLAGGAVLWAVWPGWTGTTALVAAGWVVYTVGGGFEEFRGLW